MSELHEEDLDVVVNVIPSTYVGVTISGFLGFIMPLILESDAQPIKIPQP